MPGESTAGEAPRIFVEVSDLLAHFRGFRTPMGVARVQMALLEAAPERFVPIAHHRAAGLRLVPPALLKGLMAGARAGGPRDAPDWVAGLDSAEVALARAGAPLRARRPRRLPRPARRGRAAPPARAARHPWHPSLPAVLRRHPAHGA